MELPKLKRVKVSSEEQLRNWLARNAASAQDVMIVTCSRKSADKHVSSERVRKVAEEHGWKTGRSYTLDGDLLGHIVHSR